MRLVLACSSWPGRCARRWRPPPRRSNRPPMHAGSTSCRGSQRAASTPAGSTSGSAGGRPVAARACGRWSTSSTSTATAAEGRSTAADPPRGPRRARERRLRGLLCRRRRDRELPARLGAVQAWHRQHGRSLLGRPFSKRFPEERWANVGGKKQRRFLLRMMERRTVRCARAGFDAVEYDVVAAHESGRRVTGWNVSYGDQLAYNRGLARIAHRHRLAVGLKNDLSQVKDLERDFDFAINEECFTYDECGMLKPFVEAGKPVFHVEYTNSRAEFCATTEALGFQSIRKGPNFGLRPLPYKPCS